MTERREPFTIILREQQHPTRIIVSVEPRVCTYPTQYFRKTRDAEDYAERLRSRTGFRLFDRRVGMAR